MNRRLLFTQWLSHFDINFLLCRTIFHWNTTLFIIIRNFVILVDAFAIDNSNVRFSFIKSTFRLNFFIFIDKLAMSILFSEFFEYSSNFKFLKWIKELQCFIQGCICVVKWMILYDHLLSLFDLYYDYLCEDLWMKLTCCSVR